MKRNSQRDGVNGGDRLISEGRPNLTLSQPAMIHQYKAGVWPLHAVPTCQSGQDRGYASKGDKILADTVIIHMVGSHCSYLIHTDKVNDDM